MKKINEQALQYKAEAAAAGIIRMMFKWLKIVLTLVCIQTIFFMNSFYSFKQGGKNYPIDMTKRKDLNKRVESQIRSFGEKAIEYVATYS